MTKPELEESIHNPHPSNCQNGAVQVTKAMRTKVRDGYPCLLWTVLCGL